jgi:hypothetical protein
MVIVIYPEDLPKGENFLGDRKNPKLADVMITVIPQATIIAQDIVLYKYGNKTIVLKSAESI